MSDSLLDSILTQIPAKAAAAAPAAPDPKPAAAAPAAAPAAEEPEPVKPLPGQQTGKTIHRFGPQFEEVFGPRRNPPKGAPGTT
jgi:hypothetical protein